MDRRTSRWPVAMFLVTAVALVQFVLFAAAAYFAWRDLSPGSASAILTPLPCFSHVLKNQLIFPVGECAFPVVLGVRTNRIRAVDLATGDTRDFSTPGLSLTYPMSILCDGQNLWYVVADDVMRFDGTAVTSFTTKNMPALTARVSDLFLHQGKLALIFSDGADQYRLSVLEDTVDQGRWVTGQRVALPGRNRIWQADERTGAPYLVPLTAPKSLVTSSIFYRVNVLQAEGEIHLLQMDMQGPITAGDKTATCYHKGLELIAEAEGEAASSALAPENLLPDVVDWTLLDSKSLRPMMGSLFAIDGGIGFTSGCEIWRQVKTSDEHAPVKFKVLQTVENEKIGEISVTQDVQTKSIYVISNFLKEAIDLYRLEGSQLQRMPIRIEGMAAGVLLWMVKQTSLGLGVIAVGFLGLVVIGNLWCGSTPYTFGHDTVILASLLRRAAARAIDLSFMICPLIGCAIWLFGNQFHWSLFELMSNDKLAMFQPLVPFIMWGIVYGCSSAVTTGLWGITPGKWVCQIRVVRSTLRRCGFARALLRELLLWIDMPQFLTAIPGVVCIMGTQHRQRIGDLIAGTVVVMRRSQIAFGTLQPSFDTAYND